MGKLTTAYEAGMAALAVASVALLFMVDDASLGIQIDQVLWVDLAIVAIFVADWLWQAKRSKRPGRYMLRHAWELLGMVPLVLPFPDAFRLLRLVRLVRIVRVFGLAKRFLRAFDDVARRSHVLRLGGISLTITLIGAVMVWIVERGSNPHLADFGESLWWAIVTVTTVGYGDITPQSALGRVIASVLMVTGIGTIGLLASTLSSAFIRAPSSDLAAQLAGLAKLHESGALSNEEFATAKAKVLEKAQ